jgi:beta-glucosidase
MRQIIFLIILMTSLLSSCASPTTITEPTSDAQSVSTAESTPEPIEANPLYLDSDQSTAARVEDLIARMSLAEKIGQMTQVEKSSISPAEVKLFAVGSVLSGGGGSPGENNVQVWADMVDSYQEAALGTSLGIPLIYGVDAVHGHSNLKGATIFPHNIGLGAADDPELLYRIGQITALEMWATGIPWNFGPVVAVPQDIRWGRTYEGFGEDTELVSRLAIPYLQGLQTIPVNSKATGTLFSIATAKHYIGDGGTTWGTATTITMGTKYKLDQGDMQMDEAQVRELFLPPYQAAIDAGSIAVMASFNSWNGIKLHGHEYLLTEVLKEELGFHGFVVSDWQGIDQISGNYYDAVVTAINAGIDMNMVPSAYLTYLETLTSAVENGDIPMERIDDAVRRILTVKFELGLFEHPYSRPELIDHVGSVAHREVAREAVRKSMVLLKNENETLPIDKGTSVIFIAGAGGSDIGLQCGGWTIEWQGETGDITPGTTILEGIEAAVSSETQIIYDMDGSFADVVDEDSNPLVADIGIVIISEEPYAEGVGDREDLQISSADVATIEQMRERSEKMVVIILSGRPLVISEQFPIADAWIAAWLPGTEGAGVADVIFGDYPFTGKLPYTWPRSNEQLPININNVNNKIGCDGPLFPFGYGLGEAGSDPIEILECP